ncbi:MAG: hypothetical protein PVG96_13615 [Desulfobacterales bacterium]
MPRKTDTPHHFETRGVPKMSYSEIERIVDRFWSGTVCRSHRPPGSGWLGLLRPRRKKKARQRLNRYGCKRVQSIRFENTQSLKCGVGSVSDSKNIVAVGEDEL